eukprot:6153786-Prymnesium_polylepis.1
MLYLWVHRKDGVADAGAGEALCLRVSGMGCTACTAKVKSAVEKIDGVARCEVQLEDGSARVMLSGTNRDAIQRECEEALQGAGFAASPALPPQPDAGLRG